MTHAHLDVAPGITLRYARAHARGERRGAALLLHGRSEFIEKYDEVLRELTERGLEVWTFEWRGQGLSTRELDDPQKGYVADFDHYLLDLDAFYQRVVAPERLEGEPLLLFAHSMGAHVGLRYLYQRSVHVDAAVLSAPMLEITLPFPEPVARALADAALALGFGDHHIGGDYGEHQRTFPGNPWTRDPKRFWRIVEAASDQPGVQLGGPTFAWMRAAIRSMRWLRQPSIARAIETPTLLVAAGEDRVVERAPIERFAANMPHGRYLVVPGSEHEVLMERDHLRRIFWSAVDDFLRPVFSRRT